MTDNESGGVQPLRPDGTVDTEAAVALEASRRRSKRGMVIGGIVVGVLAAGAVGAVIAWQTLVGSAFASAEAVPIDADFVMTFDLLQVRDSEKVDRLVQAFTVPAAELGYIEDEDIDVLERFDETLEDEIGMSLGADVVPWIGRSVSLALWFDDGLAAGDVTNGIPADSVGGVLIAGVRDGGLATGFVDDFVTAVARETDGLVEEVPFEGGTMTSVTGDALVPDEQLFMWLDGDMMIMSTNEPDISRAIAARGGESILDHDDYDRLISELPSDRLVAMYVGTDWLADISNDPELFDLAPQAESLRESLDSFAGVAGAMTLRDEGVSFDVVYGVDDPEALPLTSFDASGLEFLDRLPDDTLFHAAVPIAEDQISDAIDSLRDVDPDMYDELAAQAEDFLGVDLFEDVLPAIGREALLAVVPTPEGLFPDQFGIGIGAVFAIGVEDRGPVGQAVNSLEDYAVDSGVNVVSFGDVSVVAEDGATLFAYSLSDDTLAIGSAPTIVDAVINGVSPSVTANPRYVELDSVLPGSGVPFFVDLQGIFDVAQLEGDQRSLYDALQAVGASGEVAGDTVRFSMLVAIDY